LLDDLQTKVCFEVVCCESNFDHRLQVRALNRLQLHVQPLQQEQPQQQVFSQPQLALDSQSRFYVVSANTVLESLPEKSISSSAVHLILQAGAVQLSARSAYATCWSATSMQQTHLSLQAVSTAASLVQERAAVRKSRVAALAIVDLCGSSSCVNFGFNEEGALHRNGRCLQVVQCYHRFNNSSVLMFVCRRH
jgi:hypothetical protein